MHKEKTPLFGNISPLDYRYYGRSEKARAALAPFFSEEARIAYQARVETALVEALAEEGVCGKDVARAVRKAAARVRAAEVYREEDRIRHDVRALANALRRRVPKSARRFVHLGLTSADVIDTANALRFRDGTRKALVPALKDVVRELVRLCEREAGTVQAGRTHGQHAEPVTFGFAMAEYVERLGERVEALERAAQALRGQASGAVGAHNAFSLLVQDPLALERRVLARLGLEPARHSVQVAPPEPFTDWAHACVTAFGVLANLADDLRHLQRSEIAEVYEHFGPAQVGSSTMPHKRNPVTFENIKSLWKAAMPRMVTAYLDQVSEHQRDLTNSASTRFLPEIAALLYLAAARMARALKKLAVDREALARNLAQAEAGMAAEPLYIALALHGHPDAHEAVRALALKAARSQKSLWELASQDPSLAPYLARFSRAQKEAVQRPARYTGVARKKALLVCRYWRKRLAF